LGDVLGRGGMSTVYRAVDTHTGTEVAAKVYGSGASDDARTRQLREAALAGDLAHDGIVRLVDFGEDDSDAGSCTYLVTELVDGPTLRERLSTRGRLTADEICTLGARLSSVLDYLHGHGIVHRDIKPANVLLPGFATNDLAKAKLADFGVAMRVEDTRVTTEGCVVGTATYLSPEQVSGTPITGASDIYSLGLMLIEALSGVASYEGSGVECALARLHRPPAIPADTPQWLATLLAAMTVMAPSERPTAAAVELALRDKDAGAAAVIAADNTSILDLGAEPTPAVAFASADSATGVLVTPRPTRRLGKGAMVGLGGAAAMLALFAIALSGQNGSGHWPPGSSPTPSSIVPAAPAPVTLSHSSSPSAVAVVKHTSAPPAKPAPPPKKHGRHGHGHD